MGSLTTGDKALVGDAGALREASRARSVHDAEQVFSLGWVGLNHVLLTSLAKFLIGDNFDLRVGGLEGLDFGAVAKHAFVIDNDGLDIGLLDGTTGRLEQMRVDVHGDGLGLQKRVLDAALAESIVGGGNGNGLRGTGVSEGGPVDAVSSLWLALGARLIGVADDMERRVQCIPGGAENVQLVGRGQAEEIGRAHV